jgi:hypothetical protein
MWFTFVTARLFLFLSFQPRLAATLLRSCSAVNSPIRRVGLAPTFKPASLAQPSLISVETPISFGTPLRMKMPERHFRGNRMLVCAQSSVRSALFVAEAVRG